MSLLKFYVEGAMHRGLIDEWHVWNFARSASDDAWLRASFPAVRRTGNDHHYHLAANTSVPLTDRHHIRLAIRANENAHIALIPRDRSTSYELVLGGWGNSAVAVRTWLPGTLPDHRSQSLKPPELVRPAPALLSARTWRPIDVEVTRRGGAVGINVVVEGRQVLQFDDPCAASSPFDVAVMTGYGGEAEWRFNNDAAESTGLFHATPERQFHQWGPVYHHYAAHASEYADTVFVKCDDDIVYFDLNGLADFIDFRRRNPDDFLVSANVVNNGVCGHVQQSLGMVPPNVLALEMPPCGLRGSLWESGTKAETLHRWFLADPQRFAASPQMRYVPEARFSINLVAWLGADMRHFETRFSDDEHELTTTIPRFLGRPNSIFLPFIAAHLSFRPQEQLMDVPLIIAAYRRLADAATPLSSRAPARVSEPI